MMTRGGRLLCIVVYSVVEPTRPFREVLLYLLYDVSGKSVFMFVHDHGCCGMHRVYAAETACYPNFPHDFFYAAGNVDEFCSVSC